MDKWFPLRCLSTCEIFWQVLSLVALGCACCQAAGPQQWHDLGITIWQGSRVAVELGAESRWQGLLRDPYDNRLALGASVRLSSRVDFTIEALGRQVEVQPSATRYEYRVRGGPKVQILNTPISLSSRFVFERVQRPGWHPGFNRYQTAFKLELPQHRVQPFLSASLTFLDTGFYRTRNILGVEWSTTCRISLWFGYQFESFERDGHLVPRHALRLGASFNPYTTANCH